MGRGWVFFNHASVRSYTLGRVIARLQHLSLGEACPATAGEWVGRRCGRCAGKVVRDHRDVHPDRAALLAYSARNQPRGGQGGSRGTSNGVTGMPSDTGGGRCKARDHHQEWFAEGSDLCPRDGLRAPSDDKRYPADDDTGNETLIPLTDRLRALMTQNDPDAVRAGWPRSPPELDTLAGVEAPALTAE